MTEIPATHDWIEPCDVSTTVVARETEDSDTRTALVYVDLNPDVFIETNPDVIVDLTGAFDRKQPDEVVATAISEWINILINSILHGQGEDELHSNIRRRETLFGAFVGYAQKNLLQAETDIASGQEHVYRRFRHEVSAFQPDFSAANREIDGINRAKDRKSYDIDSPAVTLETVDEYNWKRPFDTLHGSDSTRAYIQRGDTIQAVRNTSGEILWETELPGDWTAIDTAASLEDGMLWLASAEKFAIIDSLTGGHTATHTVSGPPIRCRSNRRGDIVAVLTKQRVADSIAEKNHGGDRYGKDLALYVITREGETCWGRYDIPQGTTLHGVYTGHDTETDKEATYAICSNVEQGWVAGIRCPSHTWVHQFESGVVDVHCHSDDSGNELIACTTGDGHVYGFSPSDGQRKWMYSQRIGNRSETVRAHDQPGDVPLNWNEPPEQSVVTFVAEEENAVVVHDKIQGTIERIDVESGRQQWQIRLPSKNRRTRPDWVTVAGDTAWVGEPLPDSETDEPLIRFTAIDGPTETQHWQTIIEANQIDLSVSETQLVATQYFDFETRCFARDTGEFLLRESLSLPELQLDADCYDEGTLLWVESEKLYGVDVEVFDE